MIAVQKIIHAVMVIVVQKIIHAVPMVPVNLSVVEFAVILGSAVKTMRVSPIAATVNVVVTKGDA